MNEESRPSFGADPSTLTTQQLLREIASLEKLLDQRMASNEEAVKVAHQNLTRVPTDVDKAIGHLKELTSRNIDVLVERFTAVHTKFDSVQLQFQERDIRTEQTAKDSKVAVDAALQAAKEAVGKQQEASDRAIAKSEAAVNKQIEAIVALIDSNNRALDGKIIDIKERQTLTAGKNEGLNAGWVLLTGVVAIIATVVSVAAYITSQQDKRVVAAAAAAAAAPLPPQIVYVPAPVAPTPPAVAKP